MKAITVSPLEAWLLSEYFVNVIAHGRRTPYRGEMLIGASFITPEMVDAYINFWGVVGTGQHPVDWAKGVAQNGYVAIGKLDDIIPYDPMQLNLNSRPISGVLPVKKWMLVFKDTEALDQPLSVPQSSGIRDFSLKDLRPSRYHPMSADQVENLYSLCLFLEMMEGEGNWGQVFANHFIMWPAYEKLRRKLFRRDKGRYFLRRRKWRTAFKEAFPAFEPEAILKEGD